MAHHTPGGHTLHALPIGATSRRACEYADDGPCEQELNADREPTGAVPAPAAVEELGAARAKDGKEMLEVGSRSRESAESDWAGRPPAGHKQRETENPACDVESPIRNIPVRNTIGGQVKYGP